MKIVRHMAAAGTALLLGCTGIVHAKDIDIPLAQGRPALDGSVSPAEWAGAATVDQLTQVRPREGQPPSFETRFLLMRDADFLYVAIDARDAEPARIAAHQLIQGQAFPTDDRAWIMLDPSGSKRQGYLFQVNANGVRRDALLDNLDTFNDDWDGIWDAHARVNEAGWQVEIAIPWRTLPFNFRQTHLGINFGRMLVRKGEYLLWSSEGGQDKPAYWGRAPMPEGIDSGIGLTLVPSFVLRSPADAGGTAMQPTLDAKYRMGTNWQAIASLNTDFSGTGLDNREVNLTRFPLFLPEKRYLFVQDADAFSFSHLTRHGNPFFSRRIALAADGTPLDMQGGLKLVGRGDTYTVGAMGAWQDLPGEGNTQVGVMRARWDPNANVSLGGITTWGNPDTGNDDRLVGADARLHIPGLWNRFVANLTAFAMRSAPEQSAPDTAHGAGFSLVAPNASVSGSWGAYGEAFVLPLGFQSYQGGQDWEFAQSYTFNLNSARVRSIAVESHAYRLEDTHGRLVTSTVGLTPVILTTSAGDAVSFSTTAYRDVLDAPFTYLGKHPIAPGAYRYQRHALEYAGASYRNLALSAGYEWGGFFDGTRRDAHAAIVWSPSPHFGLSAGYVRNQARFPTSSADADTYRMGVDVAPDLAWSFSAVAQYDSVSGQLASLARVRYLPRAGRVYELSYRHERMDETSAASRADAGVAALKVSWVYQF